MGTDIKVNDTVLIVRGVGKAAVSDIMKYLGREALVIREVQEGELLARGMNTEYPPYFEVQLTNGGQLGCGSHTWFMKLKPDKEQEKDFAREQRRDRATA